MREFVDACLRFQAPALLASVQVCGHGGESGCNARTGLKSPMVAHSPPYVDPRHGA
jgi:hypothetical protein